MNLMTYVQRNQENLKQRPINVMDLLGFAWLTYCDYGKKNGLWPLSFARLYRDPYYRDIAAFKESFFPKKSQRFFSLVAASKRLKDAQILDYSCIRDPKKPVQFGALAVRLGENIVIAYEGTDITREGWEEDFMLSYRHTIPSYGLAMEFYQRIAATTEGPIYLVGHSKGGNIAQYILARCEDDSRIVGSYSFEGPGFRDHHFFDDHPERTAKMVKYIPQSAIVGVIFEDKAETKIVQSTQVAILQHDPFSWVIKGHDFVYRKETTWSSRVVYGTVNGWIDSLEDEDKKRFSSLFFTATTKMKVRDYTQFFKVFPTKLPFLYAQYKHFNPEDQAFCRQIMRTLVEHIRQGLASAKKEPAPKKKALPKPKETKPKKTPEKKKPEPKKKRPSK